VENGQNKKSYIDDILSSNVREPFLFNCQPNSNDFFVIDYKQLENQCPKLGLRGYWKFTNEMSKLNIIELCDYLHTLNKVVVLFSPEEINFNLESISFFVETCINLKIKVFVYSFNSNINDYLKIKYPNEFGTYILANSSDTLINGGIINWTVFYDNKNIHRDIKLLFLNYNRKINRDLIITKLNKLGELINAENYISYHNHHTFDEKQYYKVYSDYAIENNIDFDFLKNLNLSPNYVNVHDQGKAQYDAQLLHLRSKFNIICEPFFGMSNDPMNFEYYNHTISRKTLYPLCYKNVIYVHSHNGLLKETLSKLGFETFFDEFDEFIQNMNDEFYYSEETQKKLEHNRKMFDKYTGNAENARYPTDRQNFVKLTQEFNDFMGKK